MKEAVAIARTERNLARGVDTVVEHLGGWSSFAVKGETIVLKPNLVAPRHAKTGATTSLELLALVAERLKDLGAHPALLETPGMEYRVEETWRFFDLPALARSSGAKILPTDDKQWVSTKIPQARVLKKARLHLAVLEHPIFNLAKLKTHIITTATLSMKNLMGICHDATKRAMYILGIHWCIVDLNRLVQPALNVIHGTVGMEGSGPSNVFPKGWAC
jgi:uncharacterized protein (DUF362 family)